METRSALLFGLMVYVAVGCGDNQLEPIVRDAGPAACTHSTCSALGAACGPVGDGCGGVLDCGSCGAGEACGVSAANQCGALCTPLTCTELGAECGTQADGCGGTIACGECPSGETCGGGGANRCGTGTCTPTTCEALGADCGPVGDGCGGVLECGSCASGEACGVETPSVCGEIPCTPTTCAAVGAECGTIPDGCGGELACPVCASGEMCGVGGANRCGPIGIDAGPPGDSGIPATCTGVTCSGHGRCVVGGGGAECLCDPGYSPRGLECVDPCGAVDCRGGTCEAEGGAPVCDCPVGSYSSGASCSTTIPGWLFEPHGDPDGAGLMFDALGQIVDIVRRTDGSLVFAANDYSHYEDRAALLATALPPMSWKTSDRAQQSYATLELPGGDLLFAGSSADDRAVVLRTSPTGVARPGWPRSYATPSGSPLTLERIGAMVLDTSGHVVLLGRALGTSPTRFATFWLRITADGALVSGPAQIGTTLSDALLPAGTPHLDGEEAGPRLVATPDGGTIAALSSARTSFRDTFRSDIVLVKIAASGSIEWQRELPSSGHETAGGIVAGPSGYFVFGTASDESGGGDVTSADVLVIRTDPLGNEVWRRSYGSRGQFDTAGGAVALGDGVVVVGRTSGLGDGGAYALRLDATGALLWQGVWSAAGAAPGGGSYSGARFNDVVMLEDGTLLAAGGVGWSTPLLFGRLPYLVRIDPATGAAR